MMGRMQTKEWITEPCKRCGKTPRYDYDGYCMDCADDLALRGLMAPRPGQHAGEAQAASTTDNKAP
jgi:hypothetical protein